MKQNGILLESGTNEIEVVEFLIGQSKFGINVIKVKEIINRVPVTFIPQIHETIEGIIELRGEIMPVVDTAKALGLPPSEKPEEDKFIVTEFNKQKLIFHVHNVTQIHRTSWASIEKPEGIYQGSASQLTGVIKLGDEFILLLDFEKMVADIHPDSAIQADEVERMESGERSKKRIIAVEDSLLLQGLLKETLHKAGFQHITFFNNGEEALNYLHSLNKAEITKEVQLLITDIEMPKMDGHYLTKQIKSTEGLSDIPVIIFSSLITDDLRHKGKIVGADGQVSKPEIVELINLIDQLVL
ncbi:chemotaxis protein [Peribacillus kribbensis]|uniref:chemotaxis protein n=1 Tax=Peribacillus kribbensis TaxID=356658 RepID=UPI000422217E|nr:chemotaxis protein [Peribacillus kribbensis]